MVESNSNKNHDPNGTSGRTMRKLMVEEWGEDQVRWLEKKIKPLGLTLKEAVTKGIELELKRIDGKN